MSEVAYYSAEGLKKLRDELEQLEHVERPRVTKEIADARDKGVLFSLHMKGTMMKVSDPIIFGHAVRAFFEAVFES